MTAPSTLFGHDGVPLYDGAHPQSRVVPGTTYSNIATSRAFSRSNLETTVTTMRVTNGYGSDGSKILINPNQIIFNPAQEFTIESQIKASVTDMNLQPNVVGSMGWDLVPWHLIADTTAWFVHEARKGLYCVQWGTPNMEAWYQNDPGVSYVKYETFYGVGISDWRYVYACDQADA